MNDEDTKYAGYLGVLSRRRLLKQAAIGGVALGAAALIGCGDDDDDDDDDDAGTASPTATTAPGTPTATATPAVATKRGGYFKGILFSGYSKPSLDLYTVGGGSIYTLYGKLWYESLIDPDFSTVEWLTGYNLVPKLAESWEAPDPSTYVFNIRPGVKFHNGQTLTAHDVNYSYDRRNEPEATSNAASLARDIASFEVVDDSTIRFVSKKADVDFIENFSAYYHAGTGIMPNGAADGLYDVEREAIGTGPYRLINYTADGTMNSARYDEYWEGNGRPFLDGVDVFTGADDTTISAAFIAGKTDTVTRPDRLQAQPIIDAVPDADVVRWAADFIYGPGLNVAAKPFDDDRVRLALNLALDRLTIEKLVSFGDGLVAGPFTIPRAGYTLTHEQLLMEPGYRQPKDADIAEAKKLLAAAGLGDGFETTLMYNPGTALITGQVAVAVQANLKKSLSVDAEIIPRERAAYTERRQESGDFDMSIEGPGGVARPGIRAQSLFSSHSNAKSAGWNDAEMDALIDSARTELDLEARGEIFQKVERRLLDLNWFLGISAGPYFGLRQKWLRDYRDNRARITSLTNPSWVWMDLDNAPDDRKSPSA